MSLYKKATTWLYGYLAVNHHPQTPEEIRFCFNVFIDEPWNVDVLKPIKQQLNIIWENVSKHLSFYSLLSVLGVYRKTSHTTTQWGLQVRSSSNITFSLDPYASFSNFFNCCILPFEGLPIALEYKELILFRFWAFLAEMSFK